MKTKYYLRELAKTVLVFSACAFIFSVIKLIPALAAKNYTGQTVGIASIVSDTEDPSGHAGGTKHHVYVDYSVDGNNYYTVVIHGRFDDPQVGDTYHIRYDTGDPEKSYVESYPNETLEYNVIRVLVSIALIAVSSLGVSALKPRQEKNTVQSESL